MARRKKPKKVKKVKPDFVLMRDVFHQGQLERWRLRRENAILWESLKNLTTAVWDKPEMIKIGDEVYVRLIQARGALSYDPRAE